MINRHIKGCSGLRQQVACDSAAIMFDQVQIGGLNAQGRGKRGLPNTLVDAPFTNTTACNAIHYHLIFPFIISAFPHLRENAFTQFTKMLCIYLPIHPASGQALLPQSPLPADAVATRKWTSGGRGGPTGI